MHTPTPPASQLHFITWHVRLRLKHLAFLYIFLQLDAAADGYVRAEAAAMMALAHPSVAEGEGAAPVLGLITSSCVNQVRLNTVWWIITFKLQLACT